MLGAVRGVVSVLSIATIAPIFSQANGALVPMVEVVRL